MLSLDDELRSRLGDPDEAQRGLDSVSVLKPKAVPLSTSRGLRDENAPRGVLRKAIGIVWLMNKDRSRAEECPYDGSLLPGDH